MKKKEFILILLLGAIYFNASADSEQAPIRMHTLPLSPNASTLGEYGKAPVSLFNGTADITIPLYEIDFCSKKIPIALSYNTSGIKVAQEASWVGLGWHLSAGGGIVRELRDGNDFYANGKAEPYIFGQIHQILRTSSTSNP